MITWTGEASMSDLADRLAKAAAYWEGGDQRADVVVLFYQSAARIRELEAALRDLRKALKK